MTEAWRYGCPEGHVAIRVRVERECENPVYCNTCKTAYPVKIDRKTGEAIRP